MHDPKKPFIFNVDARMTDNSNYYPEKSPNFKVGDQVVVDSKVYRDFNGEGIVHDIKLMHNGEFMYTILTDNGIRYLFESEIY